MDDLIINIDHDDDIIATRSKNSVIINRENRTIKFFEVEYTIDEILAISQKLEDMGIKRKELTFSWWRNVGGEVDNVNLGELPPFYPCRCDVEHIIFTNG